MLNISLTLHTSPRIYISWITFNSSADCCKMSEKLCLKWNDFQETVNTAFQSFRSDKDFSDVTLACEDGQQFEAHKVILAASSPSFHHLLKATKHAHPLIYMRGVSSDDLDAIINFLYCGEANVLQENLDSFLALAEEFKLKGLTGQRNEGEENSRAPLPAKPRSVVNNESTLTNSSQRPAASELDEFVNNERRVAIPAGSIGSDHLKELDVMVKSMMENSENMIQYGSQRTTAKICKVCGKLGNPTVIKDHIEANHLDGVSLPCKNCGIKFRSRCNLRKHNCKNRSYS